MTSNTAHRQASLAPGILALAGTSSTRSSRLTMSRSLLSLLLLAVLTGCAEAPRPVSLPQVTFLHPVEGRKLAEPRAPLNLTEAEPARQRAAAIERHRESIGSTLAATLTAKQTPSGYELHADIGFSYADVYYWYLYRNNNLVGSLGNTSGFDDFITFTLPLNVTPGNYTVATDVYVWSYPNQYWVTWAFTTNSVTLPLPAPCQQLVQYHNGQSIAATYDGANCYIKPVPPSSSPFIYQNGYYIKASAGSTCPIGQYDGANCFVMPLPSKAFIYQNALYTPYDTCSTGSNDSANCFLGTAPPFTNIFEYQGSYYHTPAPGATKCPLQWSWYDTANCHVIQKAAGGFVYNNAFYHTYDACSVGVDDTANCRLVTAPWGTTAFMYQGNFYTTSIPNCQEGAYDGANCYIMKAPSGTTAFIYQGGFYYQE